LSCHLDALVARATASPVDFFEGTRFRIARQGLACGNGSRIREFEEFRLRCHYTLVLDRLRQGRHQPTVYNEQCLQLPPAVAITGAKDVRCRTATIWHRHQLFPAPSVLRK
jgi:hypothetical protein